MSSEKVWVRFEVKKSYGTVLKLRIQDFPSSRNSEVVDMMVNFYIKDEPIHKALGVAKSPDAVEGYANYLLENVFSDPSIRVVVCCADVTEEIKDIMGASIVYLADGVHYWDEFTKEIKELGDATTMTELFDIFIECATNFDPIKKYNLANYYDDRAVIVLPEYRGLGIAENFFKVRRMMCEAHGVPMTGAWMTAYGSQKAAARDGWETVSEIKYADLAMKYDVTFTDVPPTMKFMLAKAKTN